MALSHADGCPDGKKGEESYERSFVRGASRFTAKVTRCRKCGARENTKPKKVED